MFRSLPARVLVLPMVLRDWRFSRPMRTLSLGYSGAKDIAWTMERRAGLPSRLFFVEVEPCMFSEERSFDKREESYTTLIVLSEMLDIVISVSLFLFIIESYFIH